MGEHPLNGKRVLMFGNTFFNYNELIRDQLREFGCEVDLYNERPNDHVLTKIALRYRIKLIMPMVERYYSQLIQDNIHKDYDYIFVIKSETINPKILNMFRQAFPRARQILYLWDALANVPEGVKKLHCYDRALTFDPVDAKQYGLQFRPLFFAKDFEKKCTNAGDFEYEFSFIGTAHSIRPRVVKALDEQCRAQGRKSFSFLYLPNPIVFWYHKLTNPAYRNVKRSDISFTPMAAAEIGKIYDTSRCVLDVEHNKQRGLTIRTIEMLGLHKKIITTNPQVVDYDFYNPNNICVIDRNDPVVPEAFWDTPYEPISEQIIEHYSLKHFVEDIFEVKED